LGSRAGKILRFVASKHCSSTQHWLVQGISDVVQLLDTELDPVRIVAASPNPKVMEAGGLGGRKLIVASEYENLTRKWLDAKGIEVRRSLWL
jgi:ATP phosphoribosyltransferase